MWKTLKKVYSIMLTEVFACGKPCGKSGYFFHRVFIPIKSFPHFPQSYPQKVVSYPQELNSYPQVFHRQKLYIWSYPQGRQIKLSKKIVKKSVTKA